MPIPRPAMAPHLSETVSGSAAASARWASSVGGRPYTTTSSGGNGVGGALGATRHDVATSPRVADGSGEGGAAAMVPSFGLRAASLLPTPPPVVLATAWVQPPPPSSAQEASDSDASTIALLLDSEVEELS